MLATLDIDLRGLRDRAILAIGFAGGLRRSEIVGLDCGPRQTEDGAGWIEILPEGALLTIRGKTGWRDVEIGRGSRPDTCPVALLETWLRLGRIARGPLFRAVTRKNGGVGDRLTDKHVVRLVKTCALAAGLRGGPDGGRAAGRLRAGHSLRAGLASSAQIEEAHVQKHLGHASAEMTRRYQRKRDRFQVNLTKGSWALGAAGLLRDRRAMWRADRTRLLAWGWRRRRPNGGLSRCESSGNSTSENKVRGEGREWRSTGCGYRANSKLRCASWDP